MDELIKKRGNTNTLKINYKKHKVLDSNPCK